MPYWQLYYHLIWATQNREPLITSDVEDLIYGFLRSKLVGLGGTLFALNGMPDHIHLAASIPPSIAVSTFIGQVKGAAATRFNKSGVRDLPLYWQSEYGVFSFDAKRLPDVVAYVDGQKAHHAQAKLIAVLERKEDDRVRAVSEMGGDYYPTSDDAW